MSIKIKKFTNIKTCKFDNIADDALQVLHKFGDKGLFLGGGALRSLFVEEEPSDYDFFFTASSCVEAVKDYLVEDLEYVNTFSCPKGELFSYKYEDIKVQLILKTIYPSIEQCLDSFDFTATQFAYSKGTLYTSTQAIRDVLKKSLRLHKLTYPTSTINRLAKYKDKGYWTGDCITDIVQTLAAMSYEEYLLLGDTLYVD